MLPSNDPASAAGTSNPLDQPPALSVPGSDPSQGLDTLPSQPTSPDSQLPQVQAPRGFSRLPFTNTHSSR
jgi:hypothetical protein